MADPSAYWSTVAGVSVGLGIALAVEAKPLSNRLKDNPFWLQCLVGVPVIAAAAGLVNTLTRSLNMLASATPSLAEAPTTTTLLWVIATAMLVGRLASAVNPSPSAEYRRERQRVRRLKRERRLERRRSRQLGATAPADAAGPSPSE